MKPNPSAVRIYRVRWTQYQVNGDSYPVDVETKDQSFAASLATYAWRSPYCADWRYTHREVSK